MNKIIIKREISNILNFKFLHLILFLTGYTIIIPHAELFAVDSLPKSEINPKFNTTEPQSRETATTPEIMTAAVREKLSPVITSTLQELCGDDCPGFRIDTQFKKASEKSLIEDLGFTKTTHSDLPPEVKSISITILIQESVPAGSKESLKQIIAHRASNETAVPVTVQLKNLNALPPYLDKKSHLQTPLPPPQNTGIQWAKIITWPVSFVFLALMALLGLALFLKNRRDLLRDRLSAFRETQPHSQAPDQLTTTPPQATHFFETRPEDLQWLIEDLAQKQDLKSLQRIVKTYQPHDLTSRLKFAPKTLKTLASLPATAQQDASSRTEESLHWLKGSLDQAHWKRLQEKQIPLAKLSRLNPKDQVRIFAKLKSLDEKAVLIAALPEDQWPPLLTPLTPQERIQLGLALSHFESLPTHERLAMESHVASALDQLMDQLYASEHLVENLTLFLTDQEGQQLWRELTAQPSTRNSPKKPPILSLDELIQGINPQLATEIFTGLDIQTLGTLVNHVSVETRRKIIAALPKSLQARLQTYTPSTLANEAQLMRARAHLFDAYRRFSTQETGSMVQ